MIKTIILPICITFLISIGVNAQNTLPPNGSVGIGTLTPNASSLLEINSTVKGFLMSRMTLAQRNAIASPATGLLIYQTNTTPGFYFYTGSGWKALSPAAINKSLSNLTAPTAVNVDLLPGTDNVISFGSPSLRWKTLNLAGDANINGITVGLGGGTVSTNTALGNAALSMNTTGASNTAIGDSSLPSNSTGNYNTASGAYSLYSNTSGFSNTAGGAYSLYSNTSGFGNTASGVSSLYSNTTSIYNTAIGYTSLLNNTTGSWNTAAGAGALFNNTTGFSNTAIGTSTLYSNSIGYRNTATGDSALFSNTNGHGNTASGVYSLFFNTNGHGNTASGDHSLFYNSTGYNNTAIGVSALYANKTGTYNTATGMSTLADNTTGTNNTAVGAFALEYNETGSFNTASGYASLSNNTTGGSNTASGAYSLWYNRTGYGNTATGMWALYSNSTGYRNTATGDSSLIRNTTGYLNTATGFQSLYSNSTGTYNTADGMTALYSNTSGFYNTASGVYALYNNTTGAYNTAVGMLADVNSGGYNYSSAFGVGATITGSNQIRIGSVGSAVGYDPVSIGGKVGWSTLSDGRVKKNMKTNVPGLAFINKLDPITYNVDANAIDNIVQRPLIKDKDGKTIQPSKNELAATNSSNAIVYTGFVAQDVEKAAKSLNYDFSGVDAPKNDKDLYGLRYSDFVVPLVKAVQELSKMNDEKNAKIDDLQRQINELKAMIVSRQPVPVSTASLEQNIPNPFFKRQYDWLYASTKVRERPNYHFRYQW